MYTGPWDHQWARWNPEGCFLACVCARKDTPKNILICMRMWAHTHMCTYRHAWTCIGNVRTSEKRVSIVFFQSLVDIGRQNKSTPVPFAKHQTFNFQHLVYQKLSKVGVIHWSWWCWGWNLLSANGACLSLSFKLANPTTSQGQEEALALAALEAWVRNGRISHERQLLFFCFSF